ncbi:MAG TPA: hypothetical protein VMA33_03360 [Candidatus Tectomicrobia bacterium]|nr:hypothetical protein [Candidatus Tectomicrobia bacterium]
MSARDKTNIRFNGREYANADEMPVDVRAAYDRAVDDVPPVHSGARLAAKLKAKIIVNGTEFNHVGEMSADDRHSLHEALEALYQLRTSVSTTNVSTGEAGGDNGKKNSPITGALKSCLFRAARVFRQKL